MINWPWKKKPKHIPNQAEVNDLVRKHLRKEGDDGTRIRHVIHFGYPAKTDLPFKASKSEAKSSLSHLDIEFTDDEEEDIIIFEHYREVASADFDQLTFELEELYATKGWHYDGWECAVETD